MVNSFLGKLYLIAISNQKNKKIIRLPFFKTFKSYKIIQLNKNNTIAILIATKSPPKQKF